MRGLSCPLFGWLVLLTLGLPVTPAPAQDYTWFLPSDGFWDQPANWSPPGVPNGPGTTATLPASGGHTVTLDIDPVVDAFTMAGAFSLIIPLSRSLTINGIGDIQSGTLDITDGGLWGTGPITSAANHWVWGQSWLENTTLLGDLTLTGRWATSHAQLTLHGACVNDATMTFSSSGGAYLSDLTVDPGSSFLNRGTIHIVGGSTTSRRVTGPWTNEGTVLADSHSSFHTGPILNRGSFQVLPSWQVDGQTGLAFIQEAGSFDVQGIWLQDGGSFSFTGGDVLGLPYLKGAALDFGPSSTGTGHVALCAAGGTLAGTVPAGATVEVHGAWLSAGHSSVTTLGSPEVDGGLEWTTNGSYQTSLLVPPGQTLTSRGRLRFASGARCTLEGAVTSSGSFTAASLGEIKVGPFVSSGSFTVEPGIRLDLVPGTQFELAGGALDNQGEFRMEDGSFLWSGGSVTGLPFLIASDLDFGASSTAAGQVGLCGAGSTLAGTVPAGALVQLHGSWESTGLAEATTVGSPEVDGAVEWTSNGAYNTTLTVPAGQTLTNRGSLAFRSGGPVAVLDGAVDNLGSFTAGSHGELRNGPFVSSGSFTVEPSVLLDLASGSDFELAGGTLDAQGSLFQHSGRFVWSGGAVSGTVVLLDTALEFPPGSGASGEVVVGQPLSTLAGAVPAGATVKLLPSWTHGGAATLTAVGDPVIAGGLILSSGGAYLATVAVPAGQTLVNQGLLLSESGGGGGRVLDGDFLNTGTVRCELNTELRNGSLSNQGRLQVPAAGVDFTLNAATLDNQAGGRIEGDGRIVLGGATLTNHGVIAPGIAGGAAIAGFNLSGGDLDLQADGTVEIEIGGFGAGVGFDQLVVQDSVDLDGTLEVRAASGFRPQFGDHFDILWAGGSLTGDFANVKVTGFPKGMSVRTTKVGTVFEITFIPLNDLVNAMAKDLLLAPPTPGLAGQDNDFAVTQASPGQKLRLYFGSQAGSTAVSGCSGLYFDFLAPRLAGNATADDRGRATVTVLVPSQAAGMTLLFQVLEPATCRLSSPLTFLFP